MQIFGTLVPQPIVVEHMKTIDAHKNGRISEFMFRFQNGLFVSSLVNTALDPDNNENPLAGYNISIVDLWSKLTGPADVVGNNPNYEGTDLSSS